MIEKNNVTVVLTTINQPNPKIGKWGEIIGKKVVVVGDNKTPRSLNHNDCDFIDIGTRKQEDLKFRNFFLKITTRGKTLVISMP